MTPVEGRVALPAQEFPAEGFGRSETGQARCGTQVEPGELLSRQYFDCIVAGDHGRTDPSSLL